MKSRNTVEPANPLATAEDFDIRDRVREVVAAVSSRKAEDIKVLDVTKVTRFADFFVICHGSNDRQVSAIADAVDGRLRPLGVRPLHVEGEREGRWILMDYGDFVVHVFDAEQRGFYGLERLWGDAPDIAAELLPPEPAS